MIVQYAAQSNRTSEKWGTENLQSIAPRVAKILYAYFLDKNRCRAIRLVLIVDGFGRTTACLPIHRERQQSPKASVARLPISHAPALVRRQDCDERYVLPVRLLLGKMSRLRKVKASVCASVRRSEVGRSLAATITGHALPSHFAKQVTLKR
jgi:hypothetical protein